MITTKQLRCIDDNTQNQLSILLQACIETGASLGFYKASESNILTKYWQSVNRELENKLRLLYILYDNNEVQATVQLALCHKQNGRHRAEVEKLLVQPRAHRKGYATKLMAYVESQALKQGIQLLVLDTQSGDKAELFYQASGYTKVGQIPNYVSDQEGRFHSTSYYYKHLKL
ncbi:GNAT family N-acetyltransferase [Pseudoalteromonas obscura]|uniref:GNAT family N-acetyltransferase n=1 Tax=Pseudoalteromonas obscura TaxID=3048491 RepID=A0ABT7EIL8_9GAMM|nr:GNAT family N-acetyltransferase [Pseudoalteromonas sp. P94(2023)]MDK2594873.1 GNAT family N-acetyltransferase [Pseudoalteromonas sp. P94(2023)]